MTHIPTSPEVRAHHITDLALRLDTAPLIDAIREGHTLGLNVGDLHVHADLDTVALAHRCGHTAPAALARLMAHDVAVTR